MMTGDARETGAALIVVMMVMGLFAALSVALLLTSTSEAMTASYFGTHRAGLYAADAIAERAMIDIAAAPDWAALLAGADRSLFVDGPPTGTRPLADGSTIDLVETVSAAGCHKRSVCTDAELDAVTTNRPWGAANPRWRLYAHGRLGDLLPNLDSPWYVVLMIAADPQPAIGTILLRAEAFGPRHAHNVVELTAARGDGHTDYNDGTTPRTVSWREVR